MRFVIIALSIGLFVALVLAWYHGEHGAQRVTGTELLILALLLAIGFSNRFPRITKRTTGNILVLVWNRTVWHKQGRESEEYF